MKHEKTACKKNSTSKLFKTILSLVMVFSLLMSCSLIFTGCGQDSDDESTGKPNNDDKNNASKYEGLKEEEYLQALESDNLGTLVDALGEVYDAFLEGAGSSSPADLSSGAKMDLTLRLGDDLLDMLEQAVFGGDIGDMSFLSKIDLNMDVGFKDQLEKVQLGLDLNGQKIMTLNLLMGLSDYVMYMAIPELNDTYLKFDLCKMMGNAVSTALFGMTVRRLCGKTAVVGTVLPLLTVVMLVVCPVFFDLGILRVLQYFFLPTYYINAATSDRFLLLMGVYSLVLMAVYTLSGKLLGRR